MASFYARCEGCEVDQKLTVFREKCLLLPGKKNPNGPSSVPENSPKPVWRRHASLEELRLHWKKFLSVGVGHFWRDGYLWREKWTALSGPLCWPLNLAQTCNFAIDTPIVQLGDKPLSR